MIATQLLARTGEGSKAGPIWFAVVLLLCIACYFLFKSMSKHLRNVRENFPVSQTPPPTSVPSVPVEEIATDADERPVDGRPADS